MKDAVQNENEARCLIELAAEGDAEALRAVVEQHRTIVYATCLRVLRNAADAEDATQATFIVFLKKCRKLKRGTVLAGWLYRTAALVSREFVRSSARRKRREAEAGTMNGSVNQQTEEVWNDLQPELDEALMRLSQKHRDVVVLRYLQGKSTGETASLLGMSASAVSTCLARAIDQLRGRFRRRGILLSAAVLSATLAQHASAASIPASLGSSVLTVAANGAVATAVSTNVSLMVQGALAKMAWTKLQLVGLVSMIVAALAGLGLSAFNLTPRQIDALDFTEEQTARANDIMVAHRAEYLALEKKHTITIRDNEDLVQFEIAAFAQELDELKARFWQQFDQVCTERQKRVARRYLAIKNLFPFGEHTVAVEISFDGQQYTVQRKTQVSAVDQSVQAESGPTLDPRWKRFWGERKDGSDDIDLIQLVLGTVRMRLEAAEDAITFVGDKPVLSDNFVETLDLQPDKVQRVNKVLQRIRKEYLAVEKKHIDGINAAEDRDGAQRFEVRPFHRQRNNLEQKLWDELGEVLDARQVRVAQNARDLGAVKNAIFDWGNATYSITITKNAIGDNPDKYGYFYEIEVSIDGGFWGPNGNFSEGSKQLADKYSRLISHQAR